MDEKFTKRFESFKNSLAHDYDGTIVTNCCQTIIHVYIDKLYDYQKKSRIYFSFINKRSFLSGTIHRLQKKSAIMQTKIPVSGAGESNLQFLLTSDTGFLFYSIPYSFRSFS